MKKIWNSTLSASAMRAFLALLTVLVLPGCGGDSISHGGATPVSTASALGASEKATGGAISAPTSTPSKPPAVVAAPAPAPAPLSAVEARRLARLKALPLLSDLSDREKLGLLWQLAGASPSQRLTAINAYPKLGVMPDRQQQILLGQLDEIVPVATPANALVCKCGGEVTRKMCVRESCADAIELQSLCNRSCGMLGAFKPQCSTTQECATGK